MWGACEQGTPLGTLAGEKWVGGGRGVVAKKNLQVPHSSPSPKDGEFLTIHYATSIEWVFFHTLLVVIVSLFIRFVCNYYG